MKEIIIKYKEIATIAVAILGLGWWAYSIDAEAGAAKKKADRLETAIILLSETVRDDSGKLKGFLIAMGIDPEKAQKWSKMPKDPPKEEGGDIALDTPWVEIDENLQVGVEKKLILDSTNTPYVLVDTLWDLRDE